jgi:hypothetical protein
LIDASVLLERKNQTLARGHGKRSDIDNGQERHGSIISVLGAGSLVLGQTRGADGDSCNM